MPNYLQSNHTTTLAASGPTLPGMVATSAGQLLQWQMRDFTDNPGSGTAIRNGTNYVNGYYTPSGMNVNGWEVELSDDNTTFTVTVPPGAVRNEHDIRISFVRHSATNSLHSYQIYLATFRVGDPYVAPVPTASLVASPNSAAPGTAVTLSFTSTDANALSIDEGVGALSGSAGTVTVYPSVTTTYTLTAAGPGGTVTAAATVTVTGASISPTASLAASPASVIPGQASVLSFNSSHASALSINHGVGAVAGPGGTVTVSPTSTTTYTLTATGPGGTTTATATVTVTALNAYAASASRSRLRRPVMVSVGGIVTPSHPLTDFSTPPSVTIALTTSQKAALGLTGGETVHSLAGLTAICGAKLQSPSVDPRTADPAASCGRAECRIDDDGTVTLFLCPGPLVQAGQTDSGLYPGSAGVPSLIGGEWHLWACLLLSAYTW